MMLSFLMICGLIRAGIHGVEFESDSQGGDEFYLGERLTLTCTATGTNMTRVAVRLNTSAEQYQGCHYSSFDDNPWGGYTSHDDTGLIPLGDLQIPRCKSIGNASGFTYTMSGDITEELGQYQGSAFYCQSRNKDRVNTMSTNSLVIGELKVAPRDLTLNVSTEIVVEGEEFTFECVSSSNSSSVYKYDVVKSNGEVVEADTYTPASTDRENLTVRCTDETHPNWKGGDTEMNQTIRPHFIQVDDRPSIVTVLNMTTDNTLTCNISGYRTLSYSWTRRNGTNATSQPDSREMKLPAGSATDGKQEKIICMATVNGTNLTADITWQIKWYYDVIPTAQITGTTTITTTKIITNSTPSGMATSTGTANGTAKETSTTVTAGGQKFETSKASLTGGIAAVVTVAFICLVGLCIFAIWKKISGNKTGSSEEEAAFQMYGGESSPSVLPAEVEPADVPPADVSLAKIQTTGVRQADATNENIYNLLEEPTVCPAVVQPRIDDERDRSDRTRSSRTPRSAGVFNPYEEVELSLNDGEETALQSDGLPPPQTHNGGPPTAPIEQPSEQSAQQPTYASIKRPMKRGRAPIAVVPARVPLTADRASDRVSDVYETVFDGPPVPPKLMVDLTDDPQSADSTASEAPPTPATTAHELTHSPALAACEFRSLHALAFYEPAATAGLASRELPPPPVSVLCEPPPASAFFAPPSALTARELLPGPEHVEMLPSDLYGLV